LCSLFLAGLARSNSQTAPLCEVVPKFPQYQDQTGGEVQVIYNSFCTHQVLIAEKSDGILTPYDATKHAGWIVVGNHNRFPQQKPLAANEAIGVVLLPVKVELWKYVLAAAVGLLIGVAAGYAVARK
jgi:hypothetical protein